MPSQSLSVTEKTQPASEGTSEKGYKSNHPRNLDTPRNRFLDSKVHYLRFWPRTKPPSNPRLGRRRGADYLPLNPPTATEATAEKAGEGIAELLDWHFRPNAVGSRNTETPFQHYLQ